MLYVIGGASRSGKTLLSRRVVTEKQVPYFPLDALLAALANGAPELGVRYGDSFIDRPVKMWPLTKPLFNFFFEEEGDFLIEGDAILPSQMKELVDSQKSIKGCFIGYTELGTEEKLSLVRQYHQGNTDWTKEFSDGDLLEMIHRMVEFSKYLEDECTKNGIKYFDISHDFEGVQDKAFEWLFSDK